MRKFTTDFDTNKDKQRTNIDQKRFFESSFTLEKKEKISNHSKSLFPFLDFLTVLSVHWILKSTQSVKVEIKLKNI